VKKYKYEFQFNHDEGSCVALWSMVRLGWQVVDCTIENGYTWLTLVLERDLGKIK